MPRSYGVARWWCLPSWRCVLREKRVIHIRALTVQFYGCSLVYSAPFIFTKKCKSHGVNINYLNSMKTPQWATKNSIILVLNFKQEWIIMLIIWGYFLKVLILVWKYNPEYKFKPPSPFLPVLLKSQARVICNSSQVSRQNHRLLETLKFSPKPNSRLQRHHVQAGLAYLRGFRLAPRHQQNSAAHRMLLRRRFIKVCSLKGCRHGNKTP